MVNAAYLTKHRPQTFSPAKVAMPRLFLSGKSPGLIGHEQFAHTATSEIIDILNERTNRKKKCKKMS
jgi:hypothetical protein